jgi:hypothetical protein
MGPAPAAPGVLYLRHPGGRKCTRMERCRCRRRELKRLLEKEVAKRAARLARRLAEPFVLLHVALAEPRSAVSLNGGKATGCADSSLPGSYRDLSEGVVSASVR